MYVPLLSVSILDFISDGGGQGGKMEGVGMYIGSGKRVIGYA